MLSRSSDKVKTPLLMFLHVKVVSPSGILRRCAFSVEAVRPTATAPNSQTVLLEYGPINLLKTKRNLLYIRNQFVPRSKHFPPRL